MGTELIIFLGQTLAGLFMNFKNLIKNIKDIQKIRRNMTSSHPVPLSVMVNITGRCNLRCEFCEKGAGQGGRPAELSFEDIKKLVDLAGRFDCPLFLGGGEPFLYPYIWDILEYCKAQGQRLSVVTNGTCFDNLTSEQFRLLSDTISIMSISIDSADPAEHDRIRGLAGTFDKIIRFVRHPDRKCRIAINSVLKPGLEGAAELIGLARELGCAINFQPIQFETNFPDLPTLEYKATLRQSMADRGDMKTQLRNLGRLARKQGVSTNLGLVKQFFEKYCKYANSREFFGDYLLVQFMCCAPLVQVTVDEQGRLCPCALLAGESLALEGDVYKKWCQQAIAYRQRWQAGQRWDICRSCSCHFAENFRSSIVAFPLINRKKLPWLFSYYIARAYRKAGRKI